MAHISDLSSWSGAGTDKTSDRHAGTRTFDTFFGENDTDTQRNTETDTRTHTQADKQELNAHMNATTARTV